MFSVCQEKTPAEATFQRDVLTLSVRAKSRIETGHLPDFDGFAQPDQGLPDVDLIEKVRQWMAAFPQWPDEPRKGLVVMAAGWVWLFGVLYVHLGEVPLRILITGIGTCLFLATTYRWAWVLALTGSVMAMLYILTIVMAYWHRSRGTALAFLVVVLCFASADFFLTRKASNAFFRKNLAPPESDATPPPVDTPAPKSTRPSPRRKKNR